jgi:hypothetical protein
LAPPSVSHLVWAERLFFGKEKTCAGGKNRTPYVVGVILLALIAPGVWFGAWSGVEGKGSGSGSTTVIKPRDEGTGLMEAKILVGVLMMKAISRDMWEISLQGAVRWRILDERVPSCRCCHPLSLFFADKIIAESGVGTFGRVLTCDDTQGGMRVAIKVVRRVRRYIDAAHFEVSC